MPLASQVALFAEERSKQSALCTLLRSYSPYTAASAAGSASGGGTSCGGAGGDGAAACGAGGGAEGGGAGGGGAGGAGAAGGGVAGGGAGGGGSGLSLVVADTRRTCEMVLFALQDDGFAAATLGVTKGEKRAAKEVSRHSTVARVLPAEALSVCAFGPQATLASFASGSLRVLVLTGATLQAVAEELCPVGHVVSYDFPSTMQDYAARLSCTGTPSRTAHLSYQPS